MQTPVQLSFRGIEPSAAVQAACEREVRKLERYFRDLVRCRVVIGRSQHRHKQGDRYEVRLGVQMPGRRLDVNRAAPVHVQHEKLALALREAFDSLRRRIEDQARVRRGAVKAHTFSPPSRRRRASTATRAR